MRPSISSSIPSEPSTMRASVVVGGVRVASIYAVNSSALRGGGGPGGSPKIPAFMPVRATKRGAERTPIAGDYDAIVCGASFAGLAMARELRSTGARVLLLDRYEIGERQTSACAAPTEWLRNLGLDGAIRQTFGSLLIHTPRAEARWPIGWTFSTFDYRQLCDLLWAQRGAGTAFETAKVDGRTGTTVHTDRGDVSAPLIVDALGWKRNLGAQLVQPPDAPLSRGLEVHPSGSGDELEIWI